MKKKKRNPKSKNHNYSKYTYKLNGVEIPRSDERYYGIHKHGSRIKIDIKRLKKINISTIPMNVLDAASRIPRSTTYFEPKHAKRSDYTVNQFRDKLKELSESWQEYKMAFSKIKTPSDIAENVRLDYLNIGWSDNEDATTEGFLAGTKRECTYLRLWISLCTQFIHQMASELLAVLLQKCVSLGFKEKDNISRGKLHNFLNDFQKRDLKIENLKSYSTYDKFFMVWNMLKHNSEDLFKKIQKKYPDMILKNNYQNGQLSQFYLKISNDYIEKMFDDLMPFYEELSKTFFDEDTDSANWNYDEYFIKNVKKEINIIANPI